MTEILGPAVARHNARGEVTVSAASVAALAVVSAFGAGYAVGRPDAAGTGHPQFAPAPAVVDTPIPYDLGEAPCEPAPQTPGDHLAPTSPDEPADCITDHGQQFTLHLRGAWTVDEVAFRPDRVLDGRRVVQVHWSFGHAGLGMYQDIREFDNPGAGIARLPLPRPGALAICVSVVVEQSERLGDTVGQDSPGPSRFELIGHPAAGPHERPLCDE